MTSSKSSSATVKFRVTVLRRRLKSFLKSKVILYPVNGPEQDRHLGSPLFAFYEIIKLAVPLKLNLAFSPGVDQNFLEAF